jgi:phosphoglycerate dehydrogenase-like enzyme
MHTGYSSTPTIELTWALILPSARHLVDENAALRAGGWQRCVGDDMAGRTLGVLSLGNVGCAVARIGKAFGMEVIAWCQNLTAERAAAAGAALVTKEELFQRADIVTVHLPLPPGAWTNEVTVRSGRLARMYEPGACIARVSPHRC